MSESQNTESAPEEVVVAVAESTSVDFDALLVDAQAFNARHHQSIADNIANRNLIQFVQDNSDPAAIDSLTEILAKAQTDKTDILSIVSTLEAKHDTELAAAKLELNNAISAAESKHDTELAAEVAARQAALNALESKHDTEKAALDAAIAAETSARETAIAAESAERQSRDSQIELERDEAFNKIGNVFTEAFKNV